MAWKETDLIADLESKYEAVDTPTIQETSYGITWMIVNVFETGKSKDASVPTARKRNVSYYVKNRGEVDEIAWYQEEPKNVSAQDPLDAGLTGNALTAALYQNDTLRIKVLGQICNTARAIFWEDAGTASHAERLVLATKVLLDAESYVKTFMAFIALDDTIRGVGGQASDAQVATVIDGWWTNVAINM